MPSSLALLTLGGFLLGVLTFVHVVICLTLLTVVLLQQKGRSADLASAFGAGPSQANVAALSAEDIVTKATKWGAIAFMVTSLILALNPPSRRASAIDSVPDDEAPAAAPVVPAATDTSAAPAVDAAAPVVTPAAETPAEGTTPPPPAE